MSISFDWIIDGASSEFAAFAKLYEASFPDDEREPTHKFVDWIKPVDIKKEDSNFLLGAYENKKLEGFLFYSFFREPCFGFFVYIAVQPEARGKGIASRLIERGEAHCQALAQQIDSEFLAVVGEVERIEDAIDEKDREKRILRLKLFDKLGLSVLSPGYVQPALTDDSEPVPLNLMWKRLSPRADGQTITIAFYDLVFGLGPDEPFVKQTVAELKA